jgi:hypothetical protein
MPPQQPDRLLDLIDDGLNLGAHDGARLSLACDRRDVATGRRRRNRRDGGSASIKLRNAQ